MKSLIFPHLIRASYGCIDVNYRYSYLRDLLNVAKKCRQCTKVVEW